MFLLLTLIRIFFFLDSFFWLWCNIHLHSFFQTITGCCQVHAQATLLFKKISIGMLQWEAIFVTFRVWLHEKQLGPFGRISYSPGCCWYVKPLLFSSCVYLIKMDDVLTDISSFEAKWDEKKKWYKHFSQPGKTDLRMHIHQFKLTKI